MNDDVFTADDLTDEDVASAGAVPWAELPHEARNRYLFWWLLDETGRLVAKAAMSPAYGPVGFDFDYALYLTGSVLRCGTPLDVEGKDLRVEYEKHLHDLNDPANPRNLFKTLAAAVAEFDAAPSGIAGDERNEAGIEVRDAAAALLATVTTPEPAELWWRGAVLRHDTPEPSTGDGSGVSDRYRFNVLNVEVDVQRRHEAVGVDGHNNTLYGDVVPHVLIDTSDLTDPRIIIQVNDDEHVYDIRNVV